VLDLCLSEWSEYQLIDSGNGRKLERFGEARIIRPEPKAWWRPDTGPEQWRKAVASFDDSGKWQLHNGRAPRAWEMSYGRLRLEARLTDMSKHVGVFPEQDPHWRWIAERLGRATARAPGAGEPRVLNLFGYTGVATLVAAAAGARVTHVDASKPALAWARRNQEASGLAAAPVRWLLDDAFRFVERELRRESRYDLILLDPPSFGRGPRGEIWKVEQQVVDLLQNLAKLLSEQPVGVVLTLYNLEASAWMLRNLMADVFPGGQLEAGELALPHKYSDKVLPLSLFTRWSPFEGTH